MQQSQDDKSTIQNSGVSLMAESQHFAIVPDDKPRLAFMLYFGAIEEILEVNYVKFSLCFQSVSR